MSTPADGGLRVVETGEATGVLPLPGGEGEPVLVIGTRKIREGLDPTCLKQALNARLAPGVTRLILNPDCHAGYGAPVGCTLVSPTHIYPGPVGMDISCSMSLLQLDLEADAVADRRVRRDLVAAVCARTPTGAGKGQRSAPKARRVPEDLARRAVLEGATPAVLGGLGVPAEWADRCEIPAHRGHDGTAGALERRLAVLARGDTFADLGEKLRQLGSYGSGNHFGECEVVEVERRARDTAAAFGLRDGRVAFLSHCGSRGLGHNLATAQFRLLERLFRKRGQPLPGGDRELVHAELGSPEADDYLDDLALAANFAVVNHLLINALVLEAFREVFPGAGGGLVYCISHNVARRETVAGRPAWVHRKGATRAFPARHPGLAGTPFSATGHPVLLPGNPRDGSLVMVAGPGAEAACCTVNHGAGRAMGRKAAERTLDQAAVDADLAAHDILSNCRPHPLDEAPAAYKDFAEVTRSVELAGLASTVARLRARFVIKDAGH